MEVLKMFHNVAIVKNFDKLSEFLKLKMNRILIFVNIKKKTYKLYEDAKLIDSKIEKWIAYGKEIGYSKRLSIEVDGDEIFFKFLQKYKNWILIGFTSFFGLIVIRR